MAELLLELFSEEIPARMQMPMAEELRQKLESRLEEEALVVTNVKSFVGPRRLVLVADGLSITQEAKVTEKRGPRADAPEQAIEGFARAAGMDMDQLTVRETGKGQFYFAVVEQKGRPTKEILKDALEEIIASLTWPKSMRWGNNETRWVRPLHNIACVFGGEVLPISVGHLTANDNTVGHRFLGSEQFTITDFKQYRDQLIQQSVIIDGDVRKKTILFEADKLAAAHNLVLQQDEKLIEEITGLIEYPNVLLGNIDTLLMNVPEEVLISSIRTHQKYLVLRDKKGKLAPYFIVVSNMQTKDEGAAIIAGNERVLRARLSDAKFFWDQDRKINLQERLPELKRVIFHATLGTVADKVTRITGLAKLLDVWVPRAHFDQTERAATLCKIDLVTEMVGEFPELQGVMGYYYAKEQGESEEVALAIKEHYAPLGPNDTVPREPVSIAIALADKADTLAGLFAVGEKPSGSKDPYALRRATLGIIRIILENELSIPLRILFEKALHNYPKTVFKTENNVEGKTLLSKRKNKKVKPQAVEDELLEFFIDRLKSLLKGKGVRHDLITAIFQAGGEDDLLRLVKRVKALETFLKTENGINLLAGYNRATNIVQIEEKKDDTEYKGSVNKNLLQQDEEIQLYEMLTGMKPTLKEALKHDQFEEAMSVLATLRGPIDGFFDQVTVNAEDLEIRKNRLQLLSQMRELCDGIANFAAIEG